MKKKMTFKESQRASMRYGAALSRLTKYTLFRFVSEAGHVCHRCGEPLTCPFDFDIDHTKSWIDSDNPTEVFFDQDNVVFTHKTCSSKAIFARERAEDRADSRTDSLVERNKAIVAARNSGKTYEQVGEEFGLTRERVRQIAPPPTGKIVRHYKRRHT